MAEYTINKFDNGRYNLKVTGAKLHFKNFAGREDDHGNSSKRVSLEIDNEQIYEFLKEDGWRFRTRKRDYDDDSKGYAEPFEELPKGEVAYPMTELKLNYHSERPPKVYLHSSENRRGTLMNETTVGRLDRAYLTDVKLLINPYYWETASGSGTKGYINVMHVTMDDDDPFAGDYEDDLPIESEDDVVPFDA